jgi:hypothetical protein
MSREKSFTKVPVIIDEAGSVPDRNDLMMLLKDRNLYVNVTATGPSTSLINLKKENIKATLNLDPVVSPTKYSLDVIVSGDPNITFKFKPEKFTIEFSKKKTKTFPIEIVPKGKLPENYYEINKTVTPSEVEISGPEVVVNSISKVVADVNIDGQKSPVSENPDLLFLDNSGSNVNTDFLVIDYKQAKVDFDIAYRKTLPFKFTPNNNVFGGDETSYTTYTFSPIKEITVQGDESVVEKLDSIDLGRFNYEVDVLKSPIIFPAPLPETRGYTFILPTGISPDLKTIDVTVDLGDAKIKNIRFGKDQLDKFTVINVPANKIPVITTTSATLSIRSLPYILDRIYADSFIGTVDFSKPSDNGEYPVSFTIPGENVYGLMNQVYVKVELQ